MLPPPFLGRRVRDTSHSASGSFFIVPVLLASLAAGLWILTVAFTSAPRVAVRCFVRFWYFFSGRFLLRVSSADIRSWVELACLATPDVARASAGLRVSQHDDPPPAQAPPARQIEIASETAHLARRDPNVRVPFQRVFDVRLISHNTPDFARFSRAASSTFP